MKPWSRKFYQSRAWKDCRGSFLASKHYICERCGDVANTAHHRIKLTQSNITNPYIALAHDNLEALCHTCHNKEHHGGGGQAREQTRRAVFDEAGRLTYMPPCVSIKKQQAKTDAEVTIYPAWVRRGV